jgi:hypothetical protein
VFQQFPGRSEHGLLFAPHVMPFQCPYVVTIDQLTVDKAGHILARSLRGDNIKVDLGSRAIEQPHVWKLNRVEITHPGIPI